MGRETRGSAKVPVAAEAIPSPAIKRKRRGSPSPARTPTIKVVVPSQTTVKTVEEKPTNKINENGEAHGNKRAKISLKVKRPSTDGKAEVEGPVLAKETPQSEVVAVQEPTAQEPEVKVEDLRPRAMSKEVRTALATVIVEMATGLPAPLNKILGLWLPPDFTQKPENTLGYVLRQDTLTWEALVDTLHVFSKNLLVPCNYPNPMPSTAQFHLPVPALPSHYPPHPIYAFCSGLYSIMAQIAPSDVAIGTTAERWGLMQKVPHAPSSSITDHGDWFTAGVDAREVGGLLEKLKKIQGDKPSEGSLLEQLASTGDRFAYANAVSMQSALTEAKPATRTLAESVVRKASLKARAWKEARASRSGGFGAGPKSVRIPPTTDSSFTPTFGAYYDSNHFFGGYYDSVDAMHERARASSWKRNARLPMPISVGQGYRGTLEGGVAKQDKGKGKEVVDDILEENAMLIEELQAWQEIRVQKGDVNWSSEREQQAAEELLASLTKLAESTKPSDLLAAKTDTAGMAHRIAQRVLQNKAPSIRGTLDPRRPHAVHDNLTVRPRSLTAQPLGGTASTPATTPSYPPRQSTMYQPPRQQPSYPSPTPYRPPTPNYTYTSPFAQQNTGLNGIGNAPRASHAQYRPPAAGPSGLRQSFGPGTGSYPNSPSAPPRTGSQRV